jgi:hypothetical protein
LIPELISSMRLAQTPFVEAERWRRRCLLIGRSWRGWHG